MEMEDAGPEVLISGLPALGFTHIPSLVPLYARHKAVKLAIIVGCPVATIHRTAYE